MKIIPAIDIIDGKCVRLSKGDYREKTVYSDKPEEVAKSFEDAGLKYLHVVDLDGAKADKPVNLKILQKIASQTSLEIDFGGGIRSKQQAQSVFDTGARQLVIGSPAVNRPEWFLEQLESFGSERIILAADFLYGKIATNAWQNSSELLLTDFLRDYRNKGVDYALCTDISKDGMLSGSAEDTYRQLTTETNLKIIASGGVSTIEELARLRSTGCYGAIVGKALYENTLSLKALYKFQSQEPC